MQSDPRIRGRLRTKNKVCFTCGYQDLRKAMVFASGDRCAIKNPMKMWCHDSLDYPSPGSQPASQPGQARQIGMPRKPASQVRELPGISQMLPLCIRDASQLFPRCIPVASQMIPKGNTDAFFSNQFHEIQVMSRQLNPSQSHTIQYNSVHSSLNKCNSTHRSSI